MIIDQDAKALDRVFEYKIPQEPILIDETVEFLRESIKNQNMDTVTFLKSFPRKKRIQIVDILRGAEPLPIDYKELNLLGSALNLPAEDIYNLWETRMKQILESSGMNIYSNAELINVMFDCAKKHLL